jgi:DNA-binding beta-propeller fold protein YncE
MTIHERKWTTMKPAMQLASTALLAVWAVAAELPSPALLVLNKEEATLAIVDPANGRVAARVSVGEGPHEVAASVDGRLAFVTNYGARNPGSTISIIDLVTPKELRRFDVSPLARPHGVTVAEGRAWFTAEGNKLIARYDPGSNRIDFLLGTGQNGTHMVLLSKDGNRIYTANIASDSISVFDRAAGSSNWNQTVAPVGKGPEGMDLTPDGRELWAAHSRDGHVSIVDVNEKKVIGTIDARTKRSNRLKFTPDGKYALISDLEGGELVIINAKSREQVKRVSLGRTPEGILMEPDGRRAFIAIAGDNHVAVLDLRSLTVTSRFETGRGPDGMAWVAAIPK